MARLWIAPAFVLCACFISSAAAQTCVSPGGPFGTGTVSWVSSCTSADEFNSICQGSLTTIGTSAVYALNFDPVFPFNIIVTPSTGTYDPAIFLIGPNSCAQTTPCIGDADDGGAGVAEVISGSGLATGNATYYLVIDSTASASGCVPSTVQFFSLPVVLQSFSID